MGLKRPRAPEPGECCGNGCSRCVWDVYYDQLQLYELQRGEEDESSEEFEDSEESEESCDQSYIGSVVVRYIDSPAFPKSVEDIVKGIDSTLTPISDVTSVKVSQGKNSSNPIHVLDLSSRLTTAAEAVPGDVIEIFAPNNIPRELGRNIVHELCTRLKVDPQQWCELHRSPFVPEGHFPPWLPFRQPITIENLLAYYVDLSSSAFLHPTFFQSLLRLYDNGKIANEDGTTDLSRAEKVKILRACALGERETEIYRRLVKGPECCYPCVCEVLDVFSFVKISLDRLLEITCKLSSRKFSVVQRQPVFSRPDGRTSNEVATRICLREIKMTKKLEEWDNRLCCNTDTVVEEFSALLQKASFARSPQPYFFGHVSLPLTQWGQRYDSCISTDDAGKSISCQRFPPLYIGTRLFGKSTFAQSLAAAVTPVLSTSSRLCLKRKVYLLGMGTGMAPLMFAVTELQKKRKMLSKHPMDKESEEGAKRLIYAPETREPFECTVWYGARTLNELVFHRDLTDALTSGAIHSYQWALSRVTNHEGIEDDMKSKLCSAARKDEKIASSLTEEITIARRKKYVTEILEGDLEKEKLREELLSGNAAVFACGPSQSLEAVTRWFQNSILSSTTRKAHDPRTIPAPSLSSGSSSDYREIAEKENPTEIWDQLLKNHQIMFDEWNNLGT